ncbi:MAG: hypothetical protein WA055_04110, partial [Candidatus Moraniibacteriota bacterium]
YEIKLVFDIINARNTSHNSRYTAGAQIPIPLRYIGTSHSCTLAEIFFCFCGNFEICDLKRDRKFDF